MNIVSEKELEYTLGKSAWDHEGSWFRKAFRFYSRIQLLVTLQMFYQ
jgi:hypothetical protein